ncbi:MAG: tetratricopeptide repeat protein [Spirochaetia bacterium]|nr:tetratricopeptide repeat protein [Spirochaetia bacterium]MBQ3648321.1 tetratricopeptide repeat protein [Spirochaetia bacterium]MBQ6674353.1 tetratricopeptide repeat protein [Spirochaetia bacterium]MBR0319153.1 tetratricopeptide repeat protein [Spirochaetia bacterium]
MISAAKYFQQGNYDKVIRILEPQVFEHRDDWKFYSYLGYSSLYTGDFIKASSYLQRALQINPTALELMYGIAVLHLKKGETADAVRLWLHILHKKPDDTYAKEGLEFINSTDNKQLSRLLTLKKCRSFLPCRDNRKKYLIKVGIVGGILFAALLCTIFLAMTCKAGDLL